MMKLDLSRLSPMLTPASLEQARQIWQWLNTRPGVYRDCLGWLSCEEAQEGCLPAILEKAREIRENADTFVLVGVGGSNQAARAVIDAIGPKGMNIVYLGNTLSAAQIARKLQALEGKSVYVHVIAKNFETLEPGSHYRILRSFMRRHYTGDELARRIIITGTEGSRLHEIAQENGHLFLPFPKPVGGRYTAFTPVGLLPIAAAGLDVQAYIEGGKRIENALRTEGYQDVFAFAAWRNECLRRGYHIEILAAFEPQLERFSHWWKQLFGESEGKDGKGIFPASIICSEDLHSMGQYIQEGPRCMLETFLHVDDPQASVVVEPDPGFGDAFDYLDGMDFAAINLAAEQATIEAHSEGGVPVSVLSVDRLDERAFGELFYFFMAVCAISGCILNVNPFDQNGVEAYKRSMFKALGK